MPQADAPNPFVSFLNTFFLCFKEKSISVCITVLNYIIILLVHLSRYANNPFAQKSTSKAQFENFQKNTYPQPIFKPFLETLTTLKVIIDYKSGWA